MSAIGVSLLGFTVLSGCGESQPNSFNLSGRVTFDGQPIPQGKIYFMPDSKTGNSGAAGYADIKNGQYNTGATDGKGHASGQMIVKIEGYDPNAESEADNGEMIIKSLFPTYDSQANLPAENSNKDFNVPAEAADRVISGEGEGKKRAVAP